MKTAARICLLVGTVAAMTALATGSASATLHGTGTASYTIDGGAPCTGVGFQWQDEEETGVPPQQGQEILVSAFSAPPSCFTSITGGYGIVAFEEDHVASTSGDVTFTLQAGFVNCAYTALLEGSWGTLADPLPGGKLVTLSGTATRESGLPRLCPLNAEVVIEVDSFLIST